ncbi:MAG: DUF2341 domain-containing protein [Chitinispirillaceae bacterium]|nr:DUF2341 domain-containing protein [Chitinispirillaceae bacterium]
MNRRSTTIRFLLPLLLAAACAPLDPGGSGTETTTGIVGSVVNDQGVPEADVQVRLHPDAYDPVKDNTEIPVDTTDSLGRFAFHNTGSGKYTAQAVHLKSGNSALISGIHVATDTVVTTSCTLQAPGAITAFLPSGINSAAGYVYVPGTTVFAFLESRTDFVTLGPAPAGRIPEIAYSSTNEEAVTTIRYNVQVKSGDTAVVRNPSWKYACPLILNTSATGANVAGTVVNFPVLIRLNTGNFDFSQALSAGADIRFAKQDTGFLNYEIERWDPAAEHAEVWVKVDTIRGNDSTQSIMMYWGNPGAPDNSNGAAVFDTGSGFQGVWHLNETGNTTAFDATGNQYNGTHHGMSAASAVDGMIGNAKAFDGKSSYIHLIGTAQSRLSFPENGTYTLSAWVLASAIDSAAHYIISKSNRNYNLDLSGYNLWEIYDLKSAVCWESNFAPAQSGEWKYLTGVRSGAKMRLYVDGVCADSTIDTTSSASLRDSTFDVQIGKRAESNYGYWNGVIDEAIVSNRSRSADWVRLSYMNQKKDDRLVRFTVPRE